MYSTDPLPFDITYSFLNSESFSLINELSEEWWQAYKRRNPNFLTNVYYGVQSTISTCQHCHLVSPPALFHVRSKLSSGPCLTRSTCLSPSRNRKSASRSSSNLSPPKTQRAAISPSNGPRCPWTSTTTRASSICSLRFTTRLGLRRTPRPRCSASSCAAFPTS